MSRKYLKSEEIINLWTLHTKGTNAGNIAAKLGTSSHTVLNWIKDIESSLNGIKVVREKGGTELKAAVCAIKKVALNGEAKSEAFQKLLSAIEEYVESELGNRIRKLSEMVK